MFRLKQHIVLRTLVRARRLQIRISRNHLRQTSPYVRAFAYILSLYAGPRAGQHIRRPIQRPVRTNRPFCAVLPKP